MSSSVVDFGFVREGGAVEQTVEIVNSSPAEAVYQMDLDGGRHSVFSIQPASGAIRPHGKVVLRAIYRPTHPIIHHRRVACLILHRVGETHTQSFTLFCRQPQSSPAGTRLPRPDRHLSLKAPATNCPEAGALAPVLPTARLTTVSQWGAGRSRVGLGATVRAVPFGGGREGKQTCRFADFNFCPETGESAARLSSCVVACQQRADSALDWSISPMQQYFQATQGCINAISSASASSSSHMTVVPSELVFHHKPSSASSVSSASSQPVAITNYTGERLRYARVPNKKDVWKSDVKHDFLLPFTLQPVVDGCSKLPILCVAPIMWTGATQVHLVQSELRPQAARRSARSTTGVLCLQ